MQLILKKNKKTKIFYRFPNVVKASVKENGAYNYLEWGSKSAYLRSRIEKKCNLL